MTFEKFLDNYRKSLVTKGKSSNTIKLYLRDITLYLENSKNSEISQQHLKIIPLFTKEKILDYFLDLNTSPFITFLHNPLFSFFFNLFKLIWTSFVNIFM